MKASELILRLQELVESSGKDPEVLGQSGGCCYRGHTIEAVSFGEAMYAGVKTNGEEDCIVIRV
jgi:hypothetical protein